uniref:Natural killer cells antigen CD94 n=1 Tax=Ornithorhynchus anatinus TaxID=9258 RepID=K7E816_ORNAN
MSEQQVFYTELKINNFSQPHPKRQGDKKSKDSGKEKELNYAELRLPRSSQQESKQERLDDRETSEQQVTYSELNEQRLNLSWQDQKSKGAKSRRSTNEQSVTYSELKQHNRPQQCSPSENAQSKVGSQSKLWKFTAVTLGIFCLALLTTAGFLAAQVTQQQEVSPSPLPKPSHNTISKTGCDWDPCPGDWIGFRNSCYLFSNDTKNWRDSKIACATLNSSLLWLDNQEELDFLGLFSHPAWTGLYRNGPHSSWQWEDGTAFSIHGITIQEKQPEGNCVFQRTDFLYYYNCEILIGFTCKQRTH